MTWGMRLFARLGVMTQLVMLTYLFVRCAYSVRHALTRTKIRYALERLAKISRGLYVIARTKICYGPESVTKILRGLNNNISTYKVLPQAAHQ